MGTSQAMRAEVARLSPADVAGYEKFMQASEEIFKYGFEKYGDIPFELMERHGANSTVHGELGEPQNCL